MEYGSPDSIDEPGGEQTSGFVPGLSRIVTEEWNEEVLGPVTGVPSRNHWKVRKFRIAQHLYFLRQCRASISRFPWSRGKTERVSEGASDATNSDKHQKGQQAKNKLRKT
jgi:hypothetical protein